MTTSPTPDQNRLDLGRALDSYIAGIRSDAEQLKRITESLPAVDPNGNSECPFARELYARKEKAERELIGRLPMLHQYLNAVEKELARCKGNLVVISSNETRLNGDNAKRMYSDAEVAQAAEYKRWVEKRDRIQETLEFVGRVLGAARTKQFPGGAGGETSQLEAAAGGRPAGGESVGDELEHLLAMGPVGKRAFKSAV
jgi:hypothetical protein